MSIKKLFMFFLVSFLLLSCQNSNNFAENNNKGDFYIPASTQNLNDLQNSLREISKDQAPAVVFISTQQTITQTSTDPFDFFFGNPFNMFPNDNNRGNKPQQRQFKQNALGSGLIFEKKGDTYYIITNNHVIENADTIKVAVSENKSYTGKLIGTDPNIDIAVVRISTKDNLTIARIGDSSTVRVGDLAVAVGNPFGLNGTMTFGIISAVGRNNVQTDKPTLTDFIQTDAAINPGNSGGPLLNINGEVIGINTLIYSQSGGSIGLGFAIPINIVKNTARQLINKGKVEHGYLGIYYKTLTEDDIAKLGLKNIKGGMLINQVIAKSPAEKAGLKAGNVILELNGKILASSNDLAITIGNLSPGTKVNFKILRNNQEMTKEVTLETRNEKNFANNNPQPSENNQYGMELSDLTPNIRSQFNIQGNIEGVVIMGLANGGRADQAGLNEGDVIYKINNKNIKNLSDFNNTLKNNNDMNYFYIYRDGQTIIVTM